MVLRVRLSGDSAINVCSLHVRARLRHKSGLGALVTRITHRQPLQRPIIERPLVGDKGKLLFAVHSGLLRLVGGDKSEGRPAQRWRCACLTKTNRHQTLLACIC